jgi:hypothetical protein
MATETGVTDQPLTTVKDALGAQNSDVLDKFVESMLGNSAEKAVAIEEPLQAEPEAAPDNTADLSQEPKVETPKEGDDEEKHGLTPEQQARIDKRIGKEVARRKEAEEKAAEAEAIRAERDQARTELEELKRKAAEKPEQPESAPDPTGIDPRLLTVPAIKKVYEAETNFGRAYEQSKTLIKMLRTDPEKVIKHLTDLGVPGIATDEDARERLTDLRDEALRKQLAMQGHRERATDKFWQEMQNEKVKQSEKARELYPWLKDKTSAEYKHAETSVIKRFPGILDEIDGELWLGRLTKAVMAESAPKQEAPKSAPVIPPKPPASPRAAVKSDGQAERSELFKRVEANGSKRDDLAALIKGF